MLVFLNAIGSDGIDVLEFRGFDLNLNIEGDYEVVVEYLKSYYDKVENIYVEWVKVVIFR